MNANVIDESIRRDILAQMSAGESIRAICRKPGMPHVATVMRNLAADREFSEQYARAMLVRADMKFEELDDIGQKAEETESAVKVAGLRLKADNIKWQLARMNAKKYGDKMAIGGDPDNPLRVETVVRTIVDPSKREA